MPNTSTAIILGGSSHGERVRLSGDCLKVARPLVPPQWFAHSIDGPEPFRVDSYRVIFMRLSAERSISAAVHPDISEKTGRDLLADLVYAAWERHDHGR